ncbi:MAG: PAS domain-containing protein [Pyrinomonadaceae bacterium]|nr:PAS domain-containing protein [Phycisphaerales bacterium]
MWPYLTVWFVVVLCYCLGQSAVSEDVRLRFVLFLVAGGVGCWFIWTWRDGQRKRLAEVIAGARSLAMGEEVGVSNLKRDDFDVLEGLVREASRRVSGQAKDAAKKSRNLEALIDALDEPVLATDNADAVLLCNRAAEVFLGARSGELVGRPIGELFTQAELLDMHAGAREGTVRRGRVKVTTPIGVRIFQVTASPVPAAWGQGIFGAVLVLRDVTELDHAAAVKTDFVANASHELRTPVAAIKGAAETLAQCLKDDPDSADRFVRMIQGHATRLEEMLRDLLDLSKLESTEEHVDREEVDLAVIQQSLHALFGDECARRSLTLRFEFSDELMGMRSDPKLLMLVLRNLVENASKFAYEGTAIRVRGAMVESAVGGGEQNDALPGRVVRFEVIDQGIGIPIAQQDRVFERYYQVDSARTGSGMKRGTGLGLAIVKHAVRSLGGQIGLTSIWREGTTVWFEVPVGSETGEAESIRE